MDALTSVLLPRKDPADCTLATCPIKDSIYGYRPNLFATILFLVIFSLTGFIYLFHGIRTKTWFFTIAMIGGCICEVIGYIAKLMLYHNAFSFTGFLLTVILLTIAPAFYSGGIYYTLKHICLTFNPNLSRLPPAWYTWIFITCDIISMALQGAGGALSSSSRHSGGSTLVAGANIAIAGLVSQVFTMLCFGALVTDFTIKAYRHRHMLNPATRKLRNSRKFKLFLIALTIAYFGVLIRCVYRVAELAKGWTNNPILHEQNLFICLDSLPVGLAAIVLTIWHPGYCFPKHEQENARFGRKASHDSTGEQGFASDTTSDNVKLANVDEEKINGGK